MGAVFHPVAQASMNAVYAKAAGGPPTLNGPFGNFGASAGPSPPANGAPTPGAQNTGVFAQGAAATNALTAQASMAQKSLLGA